MNDLEDDDRSLFDAARAGYEPSEEHRKSVLSGVLLRAGVVAGVTSAASAGAAAGVAAPPLAAAAAPSSLVGLALKVTLWMAIGGSLGMGGYEISRARSSAAPATAPVQRAESTSPSAAAPPGPAAPAAVQVAPTLAPSAPPDGPQPAPSNAARPASALVDAAPSAAGLASVPVTHPNAAVHPMAAQAPAVAAFPSSASSASLATPAPSAVGLALSVEARALAKVQSALKEGRNAEALRLVEEQRQQFAHGELQQERDAARIVALCAVGRVADARAAARDFLTGSPRSPFAARIRASCAGAE
jgi:hypothetical protein